MDSVFSGEVVSTLGDVVAVRNNFPRISASSFSLPVISKVNGRDGCQRFLLSFSVGLDTISFDYGKGITKVFEIIVSFLR